MKHCIPLIAAAVLVAGGCGTKEEPRPVAQQPSLMKPGDSLPPVAPTPALPAPGGEGVPLPKAGQAGDHSSPAFKGGGESDKKN